MTLLSKEQENTTRKCLLLFFLRNYNYYSIQYLYVYINIWGQRALNKYFAQAPKYVEPTVYINEQY